MSKLRGLHRNLILASVTSFLVGASSVQCGGGAQNSGGSGATQGSGAGNTGGAGTGGSTGSTGLGGQIGIDVMSQDYSAEQIYASDPPPTTCDGGGMPPPVMGTPDCPSDKNLPGCPCTQAGQTAACWTGLRKNRLHGDCKDGMTTCVMTGESLAWGPCTGEVLPSGTTGKAACTCFSGGHWQIDNLEPCFLTVTDSMNVMTTTGYASTQGMPVTCPFDMSTGMPNVPTTWSTDSLTVDCTGSFKLCYTIKAGDPKNPQPSDCVLAQSCATDYYKMANVKQTWPGLPGWSTTSAMSACVTQFMTTGGYGEMSVDGQSDECDLVNKVFQRVTYCPLSCNMPNPPPMCAMCTNGAGGNF